MDFWVEPTPVAIWQRFVKQAMFRAHKHLSEELEVYLVFMLVGMSTNTELFMRRQGEKYLTALNSSGARKYFLLRRVGDESLCISSHFQGFVGRRQSFASRSYYADLGKTAYAQLSQDLRERRMKEARLFKEVSKAFMDMEKVLIAMR